MYSVRVFSTSDRDFPPAEFGPGLTWERLTEILRREVSPEAAALFAEPVADPGRGLTHWHVEATEDPLPLSLLGEAERMRLLVALEERRGAIGAYAERLASSLAEADVRLAQALRTAVVVPDPEAHVWSISGRPLLVAWGRRASAAVPREPRVEYRRKVDPAPAPEPRAAVFSRTRAVARATAALVPIRFEPSALWPILAWLVFAALVLTIYYNLLSACAINAPLLTPLADRCPGTKQSELQRLLARNDELWATLREAETRVAQSASDCGVQAGPLSPPSRADRDSRARNGREDIARDRSRY
jgi:hypothetical protein